MGYKLRSTYAEVLLNHMEDWERIDAPIRNRKSNQIMRKKKQHKVIVSGHKFHLEYYDIRIDPKRNYKIRKQFPIQDFNNDEIEHFASQKRFNWLYAAELSSRGKDLAPVLTMQDFPFVVFDIDDKPFHEVWKIIKVDKKWKFANAHHVSISPSTSGRGAHIHILLDLADLPDNYYYNCPPDEIRTFFKTTNKYRIFNRIREYLVDSLYQDTGIRTDFEALKSDKIAVTPKEVGDINEQWKDKSPIYHKAFGNIFDDLGSSMAFVDRAIRRKVSSIMDELHAFVNDEEQINDWMDYLYEIGIEPGNCEYYEQVINIVKKNIVNIEKYLCHNYNKLFWARSKPEISIGQKNVANVFFGLDTRKNETYFRHLVLYIFGLRMEKDYVIKKLTKTYVRSFRDRRRFNDEFLDEVWYVDQRRVFAKTRILTVEAIASEMGGGSTHEVLCRQIKFLTEEMGAEFAQEHLCAALDISGANDIWERKVFVIRFSEKIESQSDVPNKRRLSKDRYSGEVVGGRVSGVGLQYNQPTL